MSHQGKSSLMWNIVDPDDPYDIRKSMIAKLPEHNQNFMGGNLQIVCLMQAAEIERISQYLQQYKLKYRQVTRKQLDRHSYEIQIKELTEKYISSQSFKSENDKLKDYIKKLSIELQQAKSNTSKASLEYQYQQLFVKYQSLLKQLQTTRTSLTSMQNSYSSINEQCKQLRIKYDKLDKQRLTQITSEREKYELKIKERIEIQVREVKHRYDSQIYELQSSVRLYKEQIQSKNMEIASLYAQQEVLKRDIVGYQNSDKDKSLIWEKKANELQIINRTLSTKAGELQGIFNRYQQLESQTKDMEVYITNLESQCNQYRAQSEGRKSIQEVQQLENKVALLSSQLERLSYLLSTKTNDLQESTTRWSYVQSDLKLKISKLEREINSSSEIEGERAKWTITENQLREKIGNLERFILQAQSKGIRGESQLKQQIIRMQKQVYQMNEEQTTLQRKYNIAINELQMSKGSIIKINELEEQLKRSYSSLKMKDEQIYNLQLKSKVSGTLQAELSALKKSNGDKDEIIRAVQSQKYQLESTINSYKRQLDNKSELRRQLEDQVMKNHKLTTRIDQLNREKQMIDKQKNTADLQTVNNYKFQIKMLEQKLGGYEVSFPKMSQEIERVNSILEQKEEYSQKLIQQIKDQKYRIQRLEDEQKRGSLINQQRIQTEIARKTAVYEQKYSKLESEYRSMRDSNDHRLKSLNIQFETKLNKASSQNQKLSEALKARDHQITDHNTQVQIKYTKQISQLNTTLTRLRQENQRFEQDKRKLRGVIESSDRQLVARQRQLYEYKQNNQVLIRDNQNKVMELSKKNQYLNREVYGLQQQIRNYPDRLLQAQRQTEQRCIKVNSSQLEEKNSIIASLERQLKSLRQEISEMRNSSVSSQDTLRNYKERLVMVSTEIERLSSLMNAKNEEIRQLKIGDERKSQEIRQLKIGDERKSQEIRQLKIGDERKSQEIRQLKIGDERKSQEIRQLKRQSQRVGGMKNEIEARITEKYTQEITSLHQKIHQYQHNLQKTETLAKQTTAFQQQNISLHQKLLIHTKNLKSQTLTISQLQKQLRQARTDKLTLQTAISQLQSTNSKLQHTHRESHRIDQSAIQQRIKQQYITELTNLRSMIKQLQQINVHTTAERDQLFSVSHHYKQRLSQLQQLQDKQGQWEQRQRSLIEKIERQIAQKSRKQIQQLQKYYKQVYIIKQREKISESLKLSIEGQYQVIIDSMKREMTELKKQYEELDKITHQYQFKIRDNIETERQLRTIIKQFQEREGSANNQQLEIKLKNSLQELQKSHQINNQLRNRLIQSENSLKKTTYEIQRLTKIIREKTVSDVSLEGLRQQLRIMEQQKNQWSQKYQKLYYTYQEMTSMQQRLQKEYENSRHKIVEYQQQIGRLEQQFEQVHLIINNLKEQINGLKEQNYRLKSDLSLEDKNRQLSAQIDRLNILLEEARAEISDTRIRLSDGVALQKRIEEYMGLMVVLFAEIETLRNRVTQTEKQRDSIRRSSLTPYRVDRSSMDRPKK